MSELVVKRVAGPEIEPYLRDLAALRIAVFREYPYLYDGTLEYEQRYLSGYARSQRGVVALALDRGAVVGASTAMPLLDYYAPLAPLFAAEGFDPERVYYFAESVLQAGYRGRGLGHRFFDVREAAAREHGFGVASFCAVERPSDHPRKPADYVPHDAFWRKRGFAPRPTLKTVFQWRDLDEAADSTKPMLFWIKELGP